MAWRIAKSLDVLRSEVNERWPDRNKASDGVIGDTAHAASASDHNPNAQGVVCAFDITHDPNGCDGTYLAELLRTHRHPDVKYVIWDGRMFSAYSRGAALPFEWRPYGGADPHTNHVHVSVGTGTDGRSQPPYDDLDSWGVLAPLTPAQETDDMAAVDQAAFDNMASQVQQLWDRRAELDDVARGVAVLLARASGSTVADAKAGEILDALAKRLEA